MSEFSQIMVGAVLAAIFGVWGNIIAKVWQKGSGGTKAVIVTVTVIAFFAVIGLAGYNGWISFPKIEPVTQQIEETETVDPSNTENTDTPIEEADLSDMTDTNAVDKPVGNVPPFDTEDTSNLIKKDRPWKIVTGLGRLILSFVAVFVLFSLLYGIFLSLKVDEDTALNMSALTLPIVFPLIAYFIFHIDMNFAGTLSVEVALIVGLIVYVDANSALIALHAHEYIILWTGTILSVCLTVLIEYEAFARLAMRQFAPPLGAFKWIADGFIALFS